MKPDDRFEERLTRLLGASRAGADPAVLSRARARLSARSAAPVVALWLARPAVLASASLLFVLCVAGTFVVRQRPPASTGEGTLLVSLLGEEDLGLPAESSEAAETGAAGDSGGVTP